MLKCANVTRGFVLLLALSNPAWAEPASPVSASFEALYMWRADQDNPAINVPNPLIDNGEKLYKFDDLQDDGAWGGALKLSYRLDERQSLWLRGFYAGQFGGDDLLFTLPNGKGHGSTSTTFSAAPGSSIVTNNTLDGFTAFKSQQESDLWGIEANYQHAISVTEAAHISLFGGPRFIKFRDDLKMKFFEDSNDLKGDNDTQTLSISTTNELYGGQLGLAFEQRLVGTLFLTGSAAFGIYANDSTVSRFFNEDQVAVTLVKDSSSGSEFSWTADLSAGLSWRLSETASIDLGYTAMYLGDLATAAAQFEKIATVDAERETHSDLWIHGVRAGGTIGF